ncbi:hypothetical protein WICPIJ_006435 [Wickerhamomyces pijperi]|uniref:GSKIP domain-containing protein n=1 Tax=Wickerhamomyces pijperi TaxID=599730 RepID=A0A9P8TLE1_WICPI|nr:hypothetical protein WICPIJ_006435 [Wickerhamomyces pijperi]
MDQIAEYRHIHSSYKDDFFTSIHLKPQQISHDEDQAIELETLEGQKYTIKVSTDGWTAVLLRRSTTPIHNHHKDQDEVDRCFETFEALAMAISAKFTAKFHQSLTRRLDNLLAAEAGSEQGRLQRFQ